MSSQEEQKDETGGDEQNDVEMETTTTWDLAREASGKMVLQSVLDDMEHRAAKQKEELQQLRRRAEEAESNFTEVKENVRSLEAKLVQEEQTKDDLSKKVREISRDVLVAKESAITEKERADRVETESDRLREEISRLSNSNRTYQNQLAEAEAQAKLDDSSLLPLQFKNQRLETENDNLRTHSTWLEGELSQKSEELARLKSSSSMDFAQARANVDAAYSERDELSIEAKQLRDQLERVQSKAEVLSRQLLAAKQEVSDVKLDSEQELTASRRLVDLQKEQLLRLEQKHDALAKRMDAMKAMAEQAETEDTTRWKERELEWKEVAQRNLKKQAEDYENQLASMKEQLEAANTRCQQAEDGLMLIEDPTTRTTASTVPRLTQGESDEPLNLTQLHGRVAQAEDALHAETIRRKKAEIRVARIEAEIEANAHILVRQRKEYEMAIQNQKELQTRLENSLDEASATRNESNMMEAEVNRLKNENQDLMEEAKILAKQVRDMLIANSSPSNADPNIALTVSQMQTANTRMYKEYNALTAKVKELEDRLEREDLHQEVQDYKAELASLQEDRRRQEVLVESIVQQRDLYRTLLNKQDSNLLAGGDESNALAIVKGQSERSKVLEAQHKQLTKEHFEAQAKLDVLERDQEAASERLLRYETLNDELTKSLDKATNEVSQGKAAVARSEAEATFYREKAHALEEAQQRNKEEIKNVAASKNRMMALNSNLEQSMANANAERSKMEDQLRQAKSKLLLAQAEAESAKAAEKRIADDANQLRNELSRQGAVLDGVQRIESSLLMKNKTDIESYKLEMSALQEKLSVMEKKHEAQLASLNESVANYELQVKQLESSQSKAAKEALEAKKESLQALQKSAALTKKATLLESQLKLAKKKLGETDANEPDVEAELRTKLESITADLEGAKTEVDTWKKRSATYEKLAKDNEAAVSAITEASKEAEKSHNEDLAKLKEELERTNTEMLKRKEIITELTNDLSAQRAEREKAVNEVKQQIAGFQTASEDYQKKAEDAESKYSQLQGEVGGLRSEMVEAQTNYERELALHAAARTDLRKAREASETANRLRNTAMEELATLRSKLMAHESNLQAEKSKLEKAEKEFESKLESARAENTLLHNQLEKINEQVGSIQSRYTTEAEATSDGASTEGASLDEEVMKLKTTVMELRELVKFVRAEKDSIQGQLDAAKRAVERERTKTSVARKSTEDVQAELDTLRESIKTNGTDVVAGDVANKLKAAEEQSRLLGDSNAHLQQQVERLQTNLSIAQQELDTSKKALQPATDTQKELESDKAALLAEKESLLREIEDWKGRVQSLVSKFNQVDPEEHLKVVKKAGDLEDQVKSLEEKKASAEEETKRIRTLASRASAQLSQNKQMVENHAKTIAKLTAEKAALLKSQKESSGSKKDLDELKEKISTLEKEREVEKIQLKGSTEMNEKLRERLRQFQKVIVDLKKEKISLDKQLTDAKSKTEEKEAEMAKTVAALKEKESATSSNTAAIAPSDPPATKEKPATKEISTPAAAPVIKPTTTSGGSTVVTTVETKTSTAGNAEKKEEKHAIPKVPAGGFKFAPSKTPTPSAASDKKDIVTVSKKRPAAALAKDDVTETKPEAKPSPKRAAPANRRSSGEVKEMSLKDKLMEKKRKLQELKKAKEALKEDAKAASEPDLKRNRTLSSDSVDMPGSPKVDTKMESKPAPPALDVKAAAFVPSAGALKAAVAEMAAKSPKAEKETDEQESGEEGEMVESDEPAKASKADTPTVAGAGPSTASIFGAGSTSSFGSGFGTGAASARSAFGASSFGKPSAAFGSGGFGAAAGGSSAFGAKKTEAAPPSASGFGSAAFLNIKPPGSSSGGAPPQFSFGTSGSSITLPTPGSAATPKMTMFNAFSTSATSLSSQASFGGGSQLSTKPLFGETKKEEEEKESAEEGEMPASEDSAGK